MIDSSHKVIKMTTVLSRSGQPLPPLPTVPLPPLPTVPLPTVPLPPTYENVTEKRITGNTLPTIPLFKLFRRMEEIQTTDNDVTYTANSRVTMKDLIAISSITLTRDNLISIINDGRPKFLLRDMMTGPVTLRIRSIVTGLLHTFIVLGDSTLLVLVKRTGKEGKDTLQFEFMKKDKEPAWIEITFDGQKMDRSLILKDNTKMDSIPGFGGRRIEIVEVESTKGLAASASNSNFTEKTLDHSSVAYFDVYRAKEKTKKVLTYTIDGHKPKSLDVTDMISKASKDKRPVIDDIQCDGHGRNQPDTYGSSDDNLFCSSGLPRADPNRYIGVPDVPKDSSTGERLYEEVRGRGIAEDMSKTNAALFQQHLELQRYYDGQNAGYIDMNGARQPTAPGMASLTRSTFASAVESGLTDIERKLGDTRLNGLPQNSTLTAARITKGEKATTTFKDVDAERKEHYGTLKVTFMFIGAEEK